MLKTVINCHVWNKGLQNQTQEVPCTVLLNYLHTFVFNIFSVFNTLHYIISIGFWQVLFIIQEQLEKSQSATSTFKCRGSTAAVLVILEVTFSSLNLLVLSTSVFDSLWFCSITSKSSTLSEEIRHHYKFPGRLNHQKFQYQEFLLCSNYSMELEPLLVARPLLRYYLILLFRMKLFQMSVSV